LDCGAALLPRLGKLPFGYGYSYSAEARSKWLIEKAREVYDEDVGSYEATVSQAVSDVDAVAASRTATATATTSTTTITTITIA
jgi:hypothetical protein